VSQKIELSCQKIISLEYGAFVAQDFSDEGNVYIFSNASLASEVMSNRKTIMNGKVGKDPEGSSWAILAHRHACYILL
jgi:hypothetical protein